MPKRIIILRHGEKHGELSLSTQGKARADALARNFLGKAARHPLFKKASTLVAITLHTVETATPSAHSWSLPVTAFSISPGLAAATKEKMLDARTQQAALDVLQRKGTVVMIWEHHRIASTTLSPECTLRHLLHLDRLGDAVPNAWLDDDYDTIWIVDYDRKGRPASFRTVSQHFRMRRAKPKQRRARKGAKRA